MKVIKVCKENESTINDILQAVNGKSTSHTYTGFQHINDLAEIAENRLDRIEIPASRRPGAHFHATSGHPVPYSYSYERVATSVQLVRKTSGWYLKDAYSTTVKTKGGDRSLFLTETQANEAHAKLSSRFIVINPEIQSII